jgi:hypothetical protein
MMLENGRLFDKREDDEYPGDRGRQTLLSRDY